MLKFADIKIVYKVLGCFFLFAIAAAGTVWFAASKMSSTDALYRNLVDTEVKAASNINRANAAMTAFRMNTWRLIAEPRASVMKEIVAEKNNSVKRWFELLDISKAQAPAFAGRIEDARSRFQALLPRFAELDRLALANEGGRAANIATEMLPPMVEFQKDFIAMGEEMLKRVDKVSDEASATVARSITLTYAILGVSMLAIFGIAFVVMQITVVRPIARLVPELNKLAGGDFNVSLPALGRKDEIGQIAAAVETVVEKVGATIGNIKQSASEVTSASAEISSSTTDLSQRTEEQAASLEETTASMTEIAETVRKNAASARQANVFATETSSVAERGGAVVGEAVVAMAHIEESSQKISDIIGVIDEIARQTNLLALNAAVEAARAGEAGRGFAVVATEVRGLAQRSSQAAKDIKELITNSNGQVKTGVELVNKAGESLAEITASIKKVAAVVADIANASVEQSAGIEQINRALTQMDEATQQNSALVEENAATARTLESQAKSMDERVAIFQLRGGEQIARVERRAAAARVSEAAAVAPPAPKREVKRSPVRVAAAGGARGMQAALATAVKADAEWKDF